MAHAGNLPVVLTRVGLEMPEIAVTVEEFLAAAKDAGTDVEVVDVPHGRHGFETLAPVEEWRDAVHRAMGSVLARLTPTAFAYPPTAERGRGSNPAAR